MIQFLIDLICYAISWPIKKIFDPADMKQQSIKGSVSSYCCCCNMEQVDRCSLDNRCKDGFYDELTSRHSPDIPGHAKAWTEAANRCIEEKKNGQR